VNCNVQPYIGLGHSIDVGEEDIEHLPMGLVNMFVDPNVTVARKYYVDKNVIYWDPKFNDIVATVNAAQVNASTSWVSQMITMNQRTQAMFDDNTTYPYLQEGTWIKQLPNFTDPKDLLTTQVDNLKTYSTATVDTLDKSVLADWRLTSTGADNYLFADWPIPVNFAYSDANLLTAGSNGFPVGDLNWFPDKKVQWKAQSAAEYAAIHNALETGKTGVNRRDSDGVPADFKLSQNYFNPFNPETTITYSIPKSGVVTLKVYDAIGQEVATLVNGFKNANQTYRVEFDGTSVANGVYFYKLSDGSYDVTKKMMLVK
jgi:hypothetical protein